MLYKTILVHVDGSGHSPDRTRVAAALAAANDAHVIGAAMSGISRYALAQMQSAVRPEVGSAAIEQHVSRLREQSRRELDNFEEQMRQSGLGSFEARLVEDDIVGGLSLQAKYADLTILTQHDSEQGDIGMVSALPEIVAMASARPVLVLPHAWTVKTEFANAVVAWDGSVEATRALHHALGLLKMTRKVRVAVFNARAYSDVHGEEPGADIALYLARHGIAVEVSQEDTDIDVGNALISRCADFEADFLVMGCYGHSRFREILLGGASRTILSSATVPVFMAH